MSDTPLLRIPYVHLDHDGVVLSTGHMPPSVGREALAKSGRLEVTEEVYAQLQHTGRWSLADGIPLLLPPLSADARRTVLAQRVRLLAASDWTQIPDVPGDEGWRARWAKYRQTLRDMTMQSGYPDAVVWPFPPSDTDTAAPPVESEPFPAPYIPPKMPQ